MTELALLALGLIAGGAAAWLAASSRSSGTIAELRSQLGRHQTDLQRKDQQIVDLHQQVRTESEQKVAAQTRFDELETSLEKQEKLLEEAKKNLTDTFKALAADTLRDSQQQFLTVARSEFATVHAEATGDLETRQKAIEGLVQPLQSSLQRYEQQILEMERSRQSAYGDLGRQLQDLQRVAGNLDLALRGQQAQPRGQWGELTLARVLELAGLPEPYVSASQPTLEGESGKLRPDRIVYLPGGRCIAIDAKAPLEAFLKAVSASTEEERVAHLKDHSRLVRGHMAKLADKKYWELLQPAPEIVVLFLPGESFFSAAVEQDEKLIQDALARQIILASPTTLLALLRAIEYGWRQESIAQNARQISELGKQLYDRMRKFAEHFEALRVALRQAVKSYNQMVGSVEKMFFPAGRRFRELGTIQEPELEIIAEIEETPRSLVAPDWETPNEAVSNHEPREAHE